MAGNRLGHKRTKRFGHAGLTGKPGLLIGFAQQCVVSLLQIGAVWPRPKNKTTQECVCYFDTRK